jgi:hypothetical protein
MDTYYNIDIIAFLAISCLINLTEIISCFRYLPANISIVLNTQFSSPWAMTTEQWFSNTIFIFDPFHWEWMAFQKLCFNKYLHKMLLKYCWTGNIFSSRTLVSTDRSYENRDERETVTSDYTIREGFGDNTFRRRW